jgi:predicted Zn-ribbon and HTH transcriptional regulator
VRDLIRKILTEQQKQSNLDRVIDSLGNHIDSDLLDRIKHYIKSYIQDKGYTVKFLNSCSTGFSGVRTENQVIICSPMTMSSIGDFIYTIFHELRHEDQMTKLQMENPLTDMDLEDFEELSEQYWNMEMDADQSAKEEVAKMILELGIPMEDAKQNFRLSNHIENYQYASNMVKSYIQRLVMDIIRMKKDGLEFNDIQDHPMVKRHLDKLEEFI